MYVYEIVSDFQVLSPVNHLKSMAIEKGINYMLCNNVNDTIRYKYVYLWVMNKHIYSGI